MHFSIDNTKKPVVERGGGDPQLGGIEGGNIWAVVMFDVLSL